MQDGQLDEAIVPIEIPRGAVNVTMDMMTQDTGLWMAEIVIPVRDICW